MTFIDDEGTVDARPVFPFTSLVGQPLLQRALLLAAVDPGLGGVLVTGPRGTAKSTAARALAELLPPLANGASSPFVTLPLSASLEQLVGTLDLGAALQGNAVRFSPGLLARAHGGVLYIDEVNLLPDALVDALLDAAASGGNTVERDGVSHHHAARFVLVGTMNPEEGELRPQLLDRFGLSVSLANPAALDERLAVLRQRLAFDDDAAGARAQSADALRALATRIVKAREALPTLAWTEPVLRRAAELAQQAGADGVRGDLACLRAARAWAAWQAQTAITPADVDAVAELALAHRRRSETPPLPAPPQRAWGAAGSAADEGTGDHGALPPQPGAQLPVRASHDAVPKKARAAALPSGAAAAGA
jgi:magnesium chelatase subunit I